MILRVAVQARTTYSPGLQELQLRQTRSREREQAAAWYWTPSTHALLQLAHTASLVRLHARMVMDGHTVQFWQMRSVEYVAATYSSGTSSLE